MHQNLLFKTSFYLAFVSLLFGLGSQPLMAQVDDSDNDGEIVLGSDVIRYYLNSLQKMPGVDATDFLNNVVDLRIKKEPDSLWVILHSKQQTEIGWNKGSSKFFRFEGVTVPKALTFRATIDSGQIRVWDVQGYPSAPAAHIQLIGFPSQIVLKAGTADLTSGLLEVEVGVLGNHLDLVARGSLKKKKVTGLDLWESLARNVFEDEYEIKAPEIDPTHE